MKSFEEVKSIYEEEKVGFDVNKEHPEKFLLSLELANDGNKEFLKKYGIELKPSEWIVLTIEPEILKKAVLRAKDLGFLEAYVQSPSFLKQDVDKVIKRIGELEHLGIPYRSEKGKYQSFLFSERGYNYVLQNSGKEVDKSPSVIDAELKELADRVMETFAMEDKKNEIYENLAKIEKQGLGIRESLIKAFEVYNDSGNLDYLISSVDEILEANKEEVKGRVA